MEATSSVPAVKSGSRRNLFVAVALVAIVAIVGIVYMSGALTPTVEITNTQATLIYKVDSQSSTQVIAQPNVVGKFKVGESLDISFPLSNTLTGGWTWRVTKIESQTTGFVYLSSSPSLPCTAPLSGSTILHIYMALPAASYRGPLYYTVTAEQVLA